MVPKDVEARILRLFAVEKWPVGSIAKELGVHHSVVTRVLKASGIPRPVVRRSSRLDPFVAFIQETLERYPSITASRIFGMVCERGYQGSPDHFRHLIAGLRPPKPPEPFLRLKALPGEEAQVDWAHFGRIQIGRAERKLLAFVMVLSYSRRIFLHFFPGQTTTYFLRGHVAALEAFGGAPRVILYDNLKSAVLDRRGDAIQFNPELLAFSVHYRIEPRPVAPYRGNEKGRVERAIRYIRSAFFEALTWRTLDELNEKAVAFCDGPAMARAWPEDPSRTVADAFKDESTSLMALPPTPYLTLERQEVCARKVPYVRFDLNEYSIPHEKMGRPLSLVATMDEVRILDGMEVVAQHRRTFEKGAVIEDHRHIDAVRQLKRRARKGLALDRLSRSVPETTAFLRHIASRRLNIGNVTLALINLLDTYGPAELRFGIDEATGRGAFHPHAVRHAIERRREALGLGPQLPITLPEDPRITEISVTPHDLADYDKESTDDDQREDEGETDSIACGA